MTSQNSTSAASSQSISLVGTMGMAPQQIHQSMSIMSGQLNPHQIAALQAQRGQTIRPVVVGGHSVSGLQNVQVLGPANHHGDGIGNVPISIITTGGQTYAIASNIHTQGATTGVPTQMHIRSLAPNAATVVNQLQATQLVQQVRNANVHQQRLPTAGTSTSNSPVTNKNAQQMNLTLPIQSSSKTPPATSTSNASHTQMLTKRKLQDLLHEIDPTETMDDDVEEVLLQIADDFIENVITSSCQIAKHRKSNTLDVKDVQLHLDRNWNMWIPGFGSEDLRPYKKLPATEAHRQRLALIKKAMKK